MSNTWTDDDDAMMQAEANTLQGQALALRVAWRHLCRTVVAEFRASYARARARRQQ